VYFPFCFPFLNLISGHGDSAVSSQLKGVKTISSNLAAFAAVLHDGTVEAWGERGECFVKKNIY